MKKENAKRKKMINSPDGIQKIMLNVLQLTLRNTRLLTAGGTSFFAMQRYAPKCRRSTSKKLINSPSYTSDLSVRLLDFIRMELPSSRRQVIPVHASQHTKRVNVFILVIHKQRSKKLTWARIAVGHTEKRSILTLIHGDIFGRFCIEDVGRHWNGNKNGLDVSSLFTKRCLLCRCGSSHVGKATG